MRGGQDRAAARHGEEVRASVFHSRANMAHTRQSQPDLGIGFHLKVRKTLIVVPSLLGSEVAAAEEGGPVRGGQDGAAARHGKEVRNPLKLILLL